MCKAIVLLSFLLSGCLSHAELVKLGYVDDAPSCKTHRIWRDAPGDKRPYAKRCYIGTTADRTVGAD